MSLRKLLKNCKNGIRGHFIISGFYFRCHMLSRFNASQTWKELLSNEVERPNTIMGVPTVYSKLIEEYEKSYALGGSNVVEFVRQTCLNKMRSVHFIFIFIFSIFILLNL
jgi:hypothetical protein